MFTTVEHARSRLGDSETTDDVLEMLIEAAGELIEQHLDRYLDSAERTGEYRCTALCTLRAFPVDSIASVQCDGEALPEDAMGGYEADMERGIIYLPRTFHNVSVTYTGGYSADSMPKAIEQACLLIVSSMLGALESGGREVASETLEGYSVSYVKSSNTAPGIRGLSMAAACLLAPYKGRL